MEIIKGKVRQPVRAILYGCEGIGKTTFASKWPKPLIIDVEGGSFQIDTDRVCPKTYAEFGGIIAELRKDCNYKTIAIDTVDWLEKLITNTVLMKTGKPSIEAFEYGKGWTMVAEEWKKCLDQLNELRKSQAVNLIMLAHSCIKHVDPPNDTGYDRYELKCSRQGNGILKEWADMILFARYETITIEEKGKSKATGEIRVMQTEHAACWDAKNRFGLKTKLKFDFAEIAGIFQADIPEALPPEQPKPEPKQVTEKAAEPAPATANVPDSGKEDVLQKVIDACKASGIRPSELMAEVARKGIATSNMKPSQLPVHTLERILGHWDTIKANIIKTRGN